MKQKNVWTFVPPLVASFAVMVGHLIAAFIDPSSSPLLLVGDRIITYTPTVLKTFAVETFGTADKPILLASIGVVILLVSAAVGRYLHNKRILIGAALLAIATLPLLLAATRPAFTWIGLAPSLALIATVVGLLYLAFKRLTTPATDVNEGEEPVLNLTRRRVLIGGSAAAMVTVAGGFWGQAIIKSKLALDAIKLPRARNPLKPKLSHFDSIKGISPLITPVEDFYRVDINLSIPVVDHKDWTLTLSRNGYDSVSYTYDDLLGMELVERDITLVCVSNTVGGKYAGSGRWLGVDLVKLLEPLNPEGGDEIDQLFATSVDGYTSSSPLKYILDGREGMIAIGYNGEPLTREHGFPARLLIPGLFGFVGATKWLEKIELTTFADKEAYWTKKKWDTDAPIRPMTRIDTPKALSTSSGDTVVAGVAWAGTLGIEKVEVSLDGKAWTEAEIDVPEGPTKDWDYWVQWKMPVKLEAGAHTVAARCVTKTGEAQDVTRRESFPSGASGIQSITFTTE